ncbi:MAG: hypothetical protein ACKVP7_07220 [Hyphomicrobiaceae bacterium]
MTPVTAEIVARVTEHESRRINCLLGQYRVWQSIQGAEIWFQYPAPLDDLKTARDPRLFHHINDLKGISVFHRGAGSIRMHLVQSVHVSRTNRLDGMCHAHLPAKSGKGRTVPFKFEHIGFALDPVMAPTLARVQITGLAHKARAFASEAEYLASASSKRLIGRGALMQVEPNEVPDVDLIYQTKPGALWLVTGIIRRSIRMTNPETGAPYVWILLETDRGDFDIVVNPEKVSGDTSTGHTLLAVVSMAGRILERLGPA